ncbi:amino acid ABC transporter permease [Pannonibacter sp. Q-1]|uniref:ABC transporter permease n=1 Tax=Pannonibacter phragmitetus TaxID=121719 RepID=A0A0U2WDI7_9HYPH|nr:amino acid ABC transporter permease [Pannonibacter phragmitetus]ALV30474.1 ABC transporter permease [Pannonibacter phragmitetus]MBA4205674.1 glutamine ABC transporter permease GlnP [Polymorphum sp.]
MFNVNYTFHWNQAFRALPQMLDGALVTLQIAVLSMIIGTVAGVLLALAKEARTAPLRWFAVCWIEAARNTPALFQVYMIYFGIPAVLQLAGRQFGIDFRAMGINVFYLDSYWAVLTGIAFNNAGYLAETFRGGLRAVPGTQMRAARSLGFNAAGAFRLIVLPQMFRAVFHPMTNQMVWAILMTSVGIFVGLNTDLTGVTQQLNARTFRTFEFFALAAVLYYVLAKIVTGGARLIAWRLFRY